MFLLSAASMSVDQTCCNHLRNEESCRVSQVPQARARLAPDLPPDVIHAALWGQGPEAAADTGRLERPLWLCQKTAGVDGAFEEHKRRLKRGHEISTGLFFLQAFRAFGFWWDMQIC